MRVFFLFFTLFLMGTTSPKKTIPPETLSHLSEAWSALEAPSSQEIALTSQVGKPGGKILDTYESKTRIIIDSSGKRETELIFLSKNEENITQKTKEKSKKDKNDGNGEPFEIVMPGEKKGQYLFSEPKKNALLLQSNFRPVHSDTPTRKFLRGRLTWDPKTLRPRWIEGQPATFPPRVKTLHVRIDFAYLAKHFLPTHQVWEGMGGVLWIKRTFHVDIRVTKYDATPQKTPISPH